MKYIVSFFYLCSILLIACHKEDTDPIPPVVEPPTVKIDHFDILPSSRSCLACYQGRDSLIFEDSLGNELVLRVNAYLNITRKSTVMNGDSVIYEYTYTEDFIRLNDDSIKYLFNIDLAPRMYTFSSYPQPIEIFDGLKIVFGQTSSFPYVYDVFHKTVDLRDFNSSSYYWALNMLEPSRTFLGTTFFEVEHTLFDSYQSLVYFNKAYGIVAFSDLDHNFWRLKI